jgi:hypothetical protein
MAERQKIIKLIKKSIFIYLLISFFISIIVGFIYKYIQVSALAYVYLSLFISIGIKRVFICLTILLPLILFFIIDVIKYKKQKCFSIIIIFLLLLKIICIIKTMDIWNEPADLFTLFTQLLSFFK